jgi:hypothetical protein
VLALLILALTVIVAGIALQSQPAGASNAGIGKPLNLTSVDNLPDWARKVIHDQQLGADYHFVATVVDLDRDGQDEILLAPAARRQDVFVPRNPLAIIRYADSAWEYQATPVSCRPNRLGSFLSHGAWDLPCRTVNGNTVLRWTGSAYVEAD